MAQIRTLHQPHRLSFAAVAAKSVPQVTPEREVDDEHQKARVKALQTVNKQATRPSKSPASAMQEREAQHPELTTKMIQGLSLVEQSSVDRPLIRTSTTTDSFEEEHSQVSGSSSGKMHNFDTKSIFSVTTFAMDDKESVRPDDSASMCAPEDIYQRLSVANGRPAHRDAAATRGRHNNTSQTVSVVIPGRRFPTLANPPRFGNLPVSPVLEHQDVEIIQSSIPIISPDEPRPTNVVSANTPDEKLLDALAVQKDRLNLLQIEEKILTFVLDHSRDNLDLPSSNGFTRMLMHKLADYYSLAHHSSDDGLSVRVFRTGYGALPTPLSQLARNITVGNAANKNAIAFKIMRREQGRRPFSSGTSTAASSSAPSKAASETGNETNSDEGVTSPVGDRQKLSLEQRQTEYNLARERIFAGYQESSTGDSALSTEDNSTNMSRSSSSSGKRKATRRQKQPKDDSFDSRSSFVPSFAPHPPYINHTHAHADPAFSPASDRNMYGVTPTQARYDYEMQSQHMHGQSAYPAHPPSQYNGYDWQNMPPSNPLFMHADGTMYVHNSPPLMHTGSYGIPMEPMPAVPDWYGSSQYTSPPLPPPPPQPIFHPGQQFPTVAPLNYPGQYYPPMAVPGPAANASRPVEAKGRLFNPQTRSFVPSTAVGKNGKLNRLKAGGAGPPDLGLPQTPQTSSTAAKDGTLQSRYGTPSSLPKKPPQTESKPIRVEPNLPTAITPKASVAVHVVPVTTST